MSSLRALMLPAALVAAFAFAAPAFAQGHAGGHGGVGHGGGGHAVGRPGGAIGGRPGGAMMRPAHPFTMGDYNAWRSGGWHHEMHDGRLGWWWVTGGLWYFYPEPIYPYPSPYVPPVTVEPTGNMWYWCPAPAGYYPYVPQCSVPWQPVPPG